MRAAAAADCRCCRLNPAPYTFSNILRRSTPHTPPHTPHTAPYAAPHAAPPRGRGSAACLRVAAGPAAYLKRWDQRASYVLLLLSVPIFVTARLRVGDVSLLRARVAGCSRSGEWTFTLAAPCFRLLWTDRRCRSFHDTYRRILPQLINVLVLFICAAYIFAVAAVESLGLAKATPDQTPQQPWQSTATLFPWHPLFGSLDWALLALWQVYVGSGWDKVMAAHDDGTGPYTKIFFILFHLVTLMLSSLMTGIILEAYVAAKELSEEGKEEGVEGSAKTFGTVRDVSVRGANQLEREMYLKDSDEFQDEELHELGQVANELGCGPQQMRRMHDHHQSCCYKLAMKASNFSLYRVVVVTQDVRGAGTHGQVSIALRGRHSESELFLLQSPDGSQPFQRGATDVFMVPANAELGELQELTVELSGADGTEGAWLLGAITVSSENEDGYYEFAHSAWLGASNSQESLTLKAKRHTADERAEFVIEVRTGEGGGTTSNISIVLIGTQGVSPPTLLDNAPDNFTSGKTDMFPIRLASPIGNLSEVELRSDGSGGSDAAWVCDSVTVAEVDQLGRRNEQGVFQFDARFDGETPETSFVQHRVRSSTASRMSID